MARIIIHVGQEEFHGELSDQHAPHTVRQIIEALPLEGEARLWGDEIYFEIPVEVGEENAVERVSKGDLGYWPAGSCLCIFYGKTPMSPSEEEIVPASAVNLVGRVADPDGLKGHSAGEHVTVRLAE